jgi:NADH-quinone oxidoreductase subunit G
MPTIVIDDQSYDVPPDRNLLHVCLSLGFNLPYFCWHPALHSVGACRQCAVKQFRDANDTHGRLVMACMTPANDGTRISLSDPDARAFRANIAEWLMVNHPHDCPVCDEGGECHLQDMIVMTGHDYRRYRGRKRTFLNQDLGPFVNHEMNRCIQCYRCVRFYRDYAGGRDFDVFALSNVVYFGRERDGVLESEFSGNLVEVCPTGVFDDKTLKAHYTRKWDLQTAPSICTHCGLGCNTIPGERYGLLRRIRNRYNGQVNGYFLCDRGRYGYEFVNSERRIRQPLLRRSRLGIAEPVRPEEALQRVAAMLWEDAKIIGIGSPRASLEANFALRTLVGPDRFYRGVSATEDGTIALALELLRTGPARTPSLADVAQADAVLVLGEDVTNTAPMLALALRQSIRQQPMRIAKKLHIPEWEDQAVRDVVQDAKGPLFLASLHATKLDDVATETYHASPDDLARLGFAVAHALEPNAPAPDGPQEPRGLAQRIAEALKSAERPLVISGCSLGSQALIQAAAQVAWALNHLGLPAGLGYVVPEGNSLGLALLGGGSLADACQVVRSGDADTVLVLENDLYRRVEAAVADELFVTARQVIVLDTLDNATTAKADVVLPALAFAESDGTLVNNEGRAQRFYSVFVPQGEVRESWRWLRDALAAGGRSEPAPWQNLDAIDAALIRELPVFAALARVAPPASFRISGQKIPRELARSSGRTAIHANIDVSEPKSPEDLDSPLAFSMEGYPGEPPPALVTHFWSPGWNSIQALNKFQQEVGGSLRGGDPGCRLIEPAAHPTLAPVAQVPPAWTRRTGKLLVVPFHHIFGSEELSVVSASIASLTPAPSIALNPEDVRDLDLHPEQEIQISLGRVVYRVALRLDPTVPAGMAGLVVGLPGQPWARLPAWYTPQAAGPWTVAQEDGP